jgi:hypothetical protein
MSEWLQVHETMMWWMGVFSVVSFFGTLIAVPMLVARIPADYFAHDERMGRSAFPRPGLHLVGVLLKNILGLVLIAMGLAMLVLPGQGVITMLFGLMLMNFPGKWALQRRIVGQPRVLQGINWMRVKANRPPLVV